LTRVLLQIMASDSPRAPATAQSVSTQSGENS
jgi:hypothetical protein